MMNKAMYPFVSYEMAAVGLKIAKRHLPQNYSYMTNEYGDWTVVIYERKIK